MKLEFDVVSKQFILAIHYWTNSAVQKFKFKLIYAVLNYLLYIHIYLYVFYMMENILNIIELCMSKLHAHRD
jgi:cellulose synthase/poly-beta-1,6-N-acetylglucosamine synthase-like glycosyltransferase